MKAIVLVISALLAAGVPAKAQLSPSPDRPGREAVSPSAAASVSVCFTPETSCRPVLIGQIEAARSEILIHAHNFTNRQIIRALVDAKKRGVDVRIIMQAKHQRLQSRALKAMIGGDIPTFIDKPGGVAHNKVMIFDRKSLITGSYNFTNAADKRNAENMLLIENSPSTVDAYVANWEHRRKLSEPASLAPAAANDNERPESDEDN